MQIIYVAYLNLSSFSQIVSPRGVGTSLILVNIITLVLNAVPINSSHLINIW